MGLFHLIEDATAITVSRGVYRQVKVYQRDGVVYVGYGSGFLRVYHEQRGTSHPNIALDEIQIKQPTKAGKFGHMELK